jgi:hypothetical protein
LVFKTVLASAEGARPHLGYGDVERAVRLPDLDRLRAPFLGEISLRGAVVEVERLDVLLTPVRLRVPKEDYVPSLLELRDDFAVFRVLFRPCFMKNRTTTLADRQMNAVSPSDRPTVI